MEKREQLGKIALMLRVMNEKLTNKDLHDYIFDKFNCIADNTFKLKDSELNEIKAYNKKNNINKDNKLIKSEIQPGTIVKFAKSDTGYLHLVIARNNYELITIRYDKYLNNEYLYATFNVEQMESCGHIYNFDLMQLLIDIRNNVISNGDIRRIKKVINEMNQIDDNLSENKDKFKIIRKLIPQK